MGEMVVGEGENKTGHEASPVRSGQIESKKKGHPAAENKREQNHEIMDLSQRHEGQKPDTHESIEGIESMGQQRCALRKMEKCRRPGGLMQAGDCLVDPPDVPDISEAVSRISEKMGVEVKDERESQETEADKVKNEGNQPLGSERGPAQIHNLVILSRSLASDFLHGNVIWAGHRSSSLFRDSNRCWRPEATWDG